MQGTMDRTLEVGTAIAQPAAGRRWLVAGGIALAVLAGGVTGVAMTTDVDLDAVRTSVTQDVPEVQVPGSGAGAGAGAGAGQEPGGAAAPPADAPPAAEAPAVPGAGAANAVPAGTYGARVLAEGWDGRGRYVVVDRGRLTDGPPAEPGVDGTRPVVFDTGAVAEERRIDLAEGYDLRFSRTAGEPSYGPGGWADFVTEVSGRSTPMLATLEVDANGELVSLAEPYRP